MLVFRFLISITPRLTALFDEEVGVCSSSLHPCRDSDSYREEEGFGLIKVVYIMEKVVLS